jgi:hypothetical protein
MIGPFVPSFGRGFGRDQAPMQGNQQANILGIMPMKCRLAGRTIAKTLKVTAG